MIGWIKQKNQGFTIVELLIVIVVIGILAAISIVAYNGISNRSYASKVSTVVDAYEKILKMYKVDNGDYPSFSDTSGSFACLTPAGTMPAEGPFVVNECDSQYNDRISPELNAKLAPYASSLPNGLFPTVEYENGYFARAITYGNYFGSWRMSYMLNGDFSCPRGTKSSWRPGTYLCVYTLN